MNVYRTSIGSSRPLSWPRLAFLFLFPPSPHFDARLPGVELERLEGADGQAEQVRQQHERLLHAVGDHDQVELALQPLEQSRGAGRVGQALWPQGEVVALAVQDRLHLVRPLREGGDSPVRNSRMALCVPALRILDVVILLLAKQPLQKFPL